MVMGYGYGGKVVSEASAYGAVGAAVGLTQEVLLREMVDAPLANGFLSGSSTSPPFLMKQLGNWGSPSVIGGFIGGGIGLGLGIEGLARGRIVKHANVSSALLGYGTTAAAGAIFNGVFPSVAWANAVAKDPSTPLTTKVSIAPRTAQSNVSVARSLIT